MFTLLKSSSINQFLSRQLPSLIISMTIAEIYYKLGSFTLECVAFLATWVVVDFVFDITNKLLFPHRQNKTS